MPPFAPLPETVPEDFLEQRFVDRVALLNHWISRFIVETRNHEGKPYPPSSLQSLDTGLLCYMREKNPDTPDFRRIIGGCEISEGQWILHL